MTVRKVTYSEVTCDFPAHPDTKRIIDRCCEVHIFDTDKIICQRCWNDVMTVESLLDFLHVEHRIVYSENA